MATVGWGSAGEGRWGLGILGWWVTSVGVSEKERDGKGGGERVGGSQCFT